MRRSRPTSWRAATAAADVVISHAGVGSALTALRCGKRPILVPREAARGEHVDDSREADSAGAGGSATSHCSELRIRCARMTSVRRAGPAL